MCVCGGGFQNILRRCPTIVSVVAILLIQFSLTHCFCNTFYPWFSRPLFFTIFLRHPFHHFFGNLSSPILFTRPYQINCFSSYSLFTSSTVFISCAYSILLTSNHAHEELQLQIYPVLRSFLFLFSINNFIKYDYYINKGIYLQFCFIATEAATCIRQ